MATNTAATAAVQYHQTMTHFLRKEVNFDDAGISSGVSMGIVPAGSIIAAVVGSVETVFNAGTTNVLVIGTSANDDAYLAAADIDETTAAVTTYAGKGALVSADTEVFVKFTETGTAATTGKAQLVLVFYPDNDQ